MAPDVARGFSLSQRQQEGRQSSLMPAVVDHIIIGARQNSLVRTLLGSVSAKVAAEASCTVTVVRPPRLASHGEQESASQTRSDESLRAGL